MNKLCTYVTIIIISMLFIVPTIGIISTDKNKIIEIDNRKIAQFPSSTHNFFSNFTKYLEDRLLFKDEITSKLYGPYSEYFKESSISSAFVQGKQNWLFLGNTENNNFDKHTKNLSINHIKLNSFIKKLEELQRAFQTDLMLFVGPDKDSIYLEYYPIPVSGKNRYFNKIKSTIEKKFNIIDPTDIFLMQKNNNILYLLDDSHWNKLGAYIGYQYLMESFKLTPISVSFSVQEHKIGDIAKLAGINSSFSYSSTKDTFSPISIDKKITYISSSYPDKRFEFTPFDTEVIKLRQQSDLLISFNPTAYYDKNILIFTDSFGDAFVPFLQATFTRVYWINRYLNNNKSLPLIKQYLHSNPNFLIYLCVERMIGD